MKTLYISILAAIFFISCGGPTVVMDSTESVDRSVAPAPGPAPEIQLDEPTTFTLDNGLQVIVVENHKLPTVNASLYFDYPSLLEGDKAGLSEFFGQVMRAGTENYTKEELDEEIDFYGIDLYTNSRSVGFNTLKKHLPKAVDLMTEVLFQPTFANAEELGKLKTQAVTGLEASSKNPDFIMSRVGNALLYGTDHPWGEYPTEDTYNSISLQDLQSHYNTYFKPNVAYLTIVGDVTVPEAKAMAEVNFSDWERGSIPEMKFSQPENIEQTEVNIIDLPSATQSNIYITNLQDLKKANSDYFGATLGDHILGGSSFAKLFLNLREDKGYTYGAYSDLGNSDEYRARFNANAKVRNEVTDSAIMAFYDELNAITLEQVDAETIQTAKSEQTGRFALGLENPSTIARFARTIFMEDLPSDFYANYLQKLNAIDANDVQDAMQRYVKTNQQRIIIVGNAEDIAEDVRALGYPVKFYDIWGNEVADPTIKADVSGLSAEDIVSKAIEAQGGETNLNAVTSMLATYTTQLPGLPTAATSTVASTKDGKKATEISATGVGTLVRVVYDGESGFIEQMGQQTPMPEDQVSAMELEHAIFPVLTLQNAESITVDNVVNVDGKPANKIVASYNNDTEIEYYFDQETGLLVQYATEVEMQGQTLVTVQMFSDFKEYNGIKIPTTMVTETGPQIITMNLTDVKWNEPIPAEQFQ